MILAHVMRPEPGGGMSLLGAFAPKFPLEPNGTLRGGVLVLLRPDPDYDNSKPGVFELQLLDEAGNGIGDALRASVVIGKPQTFFKITPVALKVPKPGAYTMVCRFEGEEIDRQLFQVEHPAVEKQP